MNILYYGASKSFASGRAAAGFPYPTPPVDPLPPIPLTAGLVMWTRGDAVPVSNNDFAAPWLDFSGTANNPNQTLNARKPLFKTNQLNGKPVVRFDGVDDFLTYPNPLGSTLSVYVVARVNSAPALSETIICGPENFLGGLILWARTNASTNWGSLNVSFAPVVAGEDLVVGEFSILGLTTEPGRIKLYRNGILKANNASQGYGSEAGEFKIGASAVGVGNCDCDIAEIVIYNIIHSDEERNIMINYLRRWGTFV